MTITLDEFAEIAALKTARMYFPAKTDAESLEMLRAWTEKTLKSEDLRSVDEQQNSVEGK